MITESAPTLLIYCIFILLFSGLAVLAWGKKIPGKGSWLVWTGILALIAGIGLEAGILGKEAFRIKVWMSGWVWSRDEIGAITVGVYHDYLNLAMSVLIAVISSAYLMNHHFISQEPLPERSYAALAISTAGVVLAWNSLTPWLVFAGQVLTIFGGFIAIGTRWDSNGESSLSARFISERSIGLLLAFFGACLLATSRSGLLFNNSEVWLTRPENFTSTWIGSILLVIGLFIQFQPFPFLGWIVTDSELSSPIRTLLNQIFPAWAAFSMLLRLEPQLTQLGLFPGFGWLALASALVTVFTGLFQKKWKLTLGSWVAAGLSLACALLAFSGPVAALGVMLGVTFGAMALSSAGAALEKKSELNETNRQKAIWIKAAAFLGAAAGTGMFGFISATGILRWTIQSINLPSQIAPFLFVLFLFVLLGWRLAWNVSRIQDGTEVPWLVILSTYICILLSLGVLWTGTITGGLLIGDPDHLMNSLFSEFFGAKATELSNAADYITASSVYWGALVIALATAYWTSGRTEDRWITLAGVIPKTSQFIASGYGIDKMMNRLNQGLVWFGKSAEGFIDIKIWADWMPKVLSTSVGTVSHTISHLDEKISATLAAVLKKLVETPARLLQFIQTGDLRWYLFFSLVSGFALLLHFLRT